MVQQTQLRQSQLIKLRWGKAPEELKSAVLMALSNLHW